MNTPQPAALPRARVMYLQPDGDCAWMPPCDTLNCTPCSVRPHRTLSAAKRAAKWANLSDQEKVALTERTFWNHRGNVLDSLRAVLKLTGDLQ